MNSASKNVVICQGPGSLKNDAGTQTGTVTLTPKKLIFASSKQGEPHITISCSRICGESMASYPPPTNACYSTTVLCHHKDCSLARLASPVQANSVSIIRKRANPKKRFFCRSTILKMWRISKLGYPKSPLRTRRKKLHRKLLLPHLPRQLPNHKGQGRPPSGSLLRKNRLPRGMSCESRSSCVTLNLPGYMRTLS